MHAKKAAKVFPEPVGALISVSCPARMCGQPAICGSVGVPNLDVNHSWTSGCAHSRPAVKGTDAVVVLMKATEVSNQKSCALLSRKLCRESKRLQNRIGSATAAARFS